MKTATYVIFVFVALFSASRAQNPPGNPHIQNLANAYQLSHAEVEECASKSNVSDDMLANVKSILMHGNSTADDQSKASCFIGCLMLKQGSIKNGKLDEEMLHEALNTNPDMDAASKALANSIVTACSNAVKDVSGTCNIARKFVQCVHKQFEIIMSNASSRSQSDV